MAQITAEQLKNVIDAVELSGDTEQLKTQSYSGRGMYGSQCLGFTCDSGDMLSAVAEIMANALDMDAMALIFSGARWDSMGRSSTIIYFPRIDADGLDFSSDEYEGDDGEDE